MTSLEEVPEFPEQDLDILQEEDDENGPMLLKTTEQNNNQSFLLISEYDLPSNLKNKTNWSQRTGVERVSVNQDYM